MLGFSGCAGDVIWPREEKHVKRHNKINPTTKIMASQIPIMADLHPHIQYEHKNEVLQLLDEELSPIELTASYKDEIWAAALEFKWFDVLARLPQDLKQEVPHVFILDNDLFKHVPGFLFKYWVSHLYLNANSFWCYFLRSPSAPYIPHWVDFNDPYICPMDDNEITIREWALLFKCCLFSNRVENLNFILNSWGMDILLQVYDLHHTILFDWVVYYGSDQLVLMSNFLPDMDFFKMEMNQNQSDLSTTLTHILTRILYRSPQNSFDQTPLHILCLYPTTTPSIIHTLLPLVDLETRDLWNNTVIHNAMLGQQLHTIQRVIQQGVNLRARNNHGLTPIHLVRDVDTADALNAVCFVDSFRDSWGRSLLFNTLMNYCVREETQFIHPERIQYNHTTIMEIVPHVTANVTVRQTENDEMKKSNLKVFRLFHYVQLDPNENEERFTLAHHLINELQCDLDLHDINGRTVAHYVVQRGDLRGLKFLYDHEADLQQTDFKDLTPIHYMAKYNHLDLLEWYIEQEPFCVTMCLDETFWLQFIEENHDKSFTRFWTQIPHFLSVDKLATLLTCAIQQNKYNLIYLILEKSTRNHIIQYSNVAVLMDAMCHMDPCLDVDKLFFVFLFDLLNVFPGTLDHPIVQSAMNLTHYNPQIQQYLTGTMKVDSFKVDQTSIDTIEVIY